MCIFRVAIFIMWFWTEKMYIIINELVKELQPKNKNLNCSEDILT